MGTVRHVQWPWALLGDIYVGAVVASGIKKLFELTTHSLRGLEDVCHEVKCHRTNVECSATAATSNPASHALTLDLCLR